MSVLINRIFYIDIRNKNNTLPTLVYLDQWKEIILKQEQSTCKVISGLKKVGLWEDYFLPVNSDFKVEIHRIEIGLKDKNEK